MKEYLTKNSNGEYQLVNHRFSEDDIEIPDGANAFLRIGNGRREIIQDGIKTAEEFVCYDNLDNDIILWQREKIEVGEAGKKFDSGKSRFSLLPKGAVNKIIDVLEFGAKKYDVDNWQKVENAKTRYYDATMRHIDLWWNGEKTDSETGIHHLAHAATNLLFLMWFDENDNP